MTATDRVAVSRSGLSRGLLAAQPHFSTLPCITKIVCCISAQRVSLPSLTSNTSAWVTLGVRPGRTSRPRATSLLSGSRCNEVHFVFDGQYRSAGWHHCHRRVAGRSIGNCADDAAMHKAVLLLDALPVREVDFSAAVLNDGQRGPDQVHHVLPVETFADTFREMRVGNMSHTPYPFNCVEGSNVTPRKTIHTRTGIPA
jgi:hypothetical protein